MIQTRRKFFKPFLAVWYLTAMIPAGETCEDFENLAGLLADRPIMIIAVR